VRSRGRQKVGARPKEEGTDVIDRVTSPELVPQLKSDLTFQSIYHLNLILPTSTSTTRTTISNTMANPKSRKRPADSSPDDSVEDPGPKGKKQKKTPSTEVQRDDDGNEYWEVRSSHPSRSTNSPTDMLGRTRSQANAASKSTTSKATSSSTSASSTRKTVKLFPARRALR